MERRIHFQPITSQVLDMFHSIDRGVFKILTETLQREPTQSMLVISFLLLLERMGVRVVMQQATTKGSMFMDYLAEDCILCLKCILSPHVPIGLEANNSLETLRQTCIAELTLAKVHRMMDVLLQRVKESLDNICPRILGDLMMNAI
ncbi:hypothetical protein HN51_070920 [Arachis hypogaea]